MGILQSKLCFKTLRQQAKFWFLWLRIDFGESLQEQRNSIGRAKLFQNSAKVYVRYTVNYRWEARRSRKEKTGFLSIHHQEDPAGVEYWIWFSGLFSLSARAAGPRVL